MFVDVFVYHDEPWFWSPAPDCKINPKEKYHLNPKHV